MVQVEKFLSPEKLDILRSSGLHKVAAALETVKSGRVFEDGEMSLAAAVQLIGEKAYEKRAAFRKIGAGISALRALRSK